MASYNRPMLALELVVLLGVFATVLADLEDSSPSYGSCLCLTSNYVNVRETSGLNGRIVGRATVGQCYRYEGRNHPRNGYRWYSMTYNSRTAWIAGDFLRVGSLSECGGSNCAGGGESQLRDSVARSMVTAASIPVISSGGCSDPTKTYCTSLENIRCKCIQDIIWFKQESGCDVSITGGTEAGHSTRITKSHSNGYKLDIRLNSCVNDYITDNFPYIGTRGDNARMYRDSKLNVYARESNHWDILYP